MCHPRNDTGRGSTGVKMISVSVVKCPSYEIDLLSGSLTRCLNNLGGLSKFIKPGQTILVKPNLLSEHTPDEAVTTHPEFMRAVVRLVKQCKAIPIIADGPSIMNVEKVYNITGMAQVAKEEKVSLVYLSDYKINQYKPEKFKFASLQNIHVSDIINQVDGIINLPKMKTHMLLTVTFGLKNLYGLIPGYTKSEYHKKAINSITFSKLTAELYSIIKPKLRLTIMDGIIGMDGEGPSHGRVRDIGIISASEDTVAHDAVLCSMINLQPGSLPLLKFCAKENLGETDLKKIVIKGDDIKINDFIIPKTHLVNYIPEFAANMVAKLVYWKPQINPDKCKLCNKCVVICPQKTISKKGNKLVVNQKNCISCFCCNEVCPEDAIVLQSGKFWNLIRTIANLNKVG
jgi:uncharacterized protein (DUF362 family)/NAD-dependent dihydropyrimidine dehydrogenase PreA subunit